MLKIKLDGAASNRTAMLNISLAEMTRLIMSEYDVRRVVLFPGGLQIYARIGIWTLTEQLINHNH